MKLLLVGVAAGDLDRVRRLAAANVDIRIVGSTVLDANGRAGLLDVPHDAVLLTPEAMRRVQGVHDDVKKDVGTRAAAILPETAAEALTAREHGVLSHAADGLGNRAIGERLGISEHTVKFHLASIYGKLGVGNRTEAVQAALRRGLLEI